MAQLTAAQNQALGVIINAVIETVRESGPMGAPGGILYAGLMARGCSYNQFVSLMRGLVRLGKLRLEDNCYHVA